MNGKFYKKTEKKEKSVFKKKEKKKWHNSEVSEPPSHPPFQEKP